MADVVVIPDELCTLETCDVSQSVYGYRPNLGENIFFTVFFLVLTFAHLVIGIKHRTWTFVVSLVLGGICEVIGNGTRIMLYQNPFDSNGFKIQLVMLTIAPVFLTAGIYLCLKHLVLTFGTGLSRIPAAWYTYIFISCDVLSLVLQAIGGGIAASAPDDDREMLDTGNNTMMAGLAFQVATLTIFAVLALDFFVQVRRDIKKTGGAGLNSHTVGLRNSLSFKGFCAALVVAYTVIQIRCIYRIVEMAGGWGSSLMQNETLFVILESMMCAIMMLVLVLFHPGSYLATMGSSSKHSPIATLDEENKAAVSSASSGSPRETNEQNTGTQ